jgi:plasmid stabilization system protein ParE
MRRVRLTPAAQEDLHAIWSYIAKGVPMRPIGSSVDLRIA